MGVWRDMSQSWIEETGALGYCSATAFGQWNRNRQLSQSTSWFAHLTPGPLMDVNEQAAVPNVSNWPAIAGPGAGPRNLRRTVKLPFR